MCYLLTHTKIGGLMEERAKEVNYCVFCESSESLREFKSMYICDSCIESTKNLELTNEEIS